MDTERRILLGRVLGAFGVRGELKLQSHTEPAMSVFGYQPWILAQSGRESEIAGATGRETAKGVVARFPGIADRDAAEALRGAELWVPRARLPAPGPDEHYWVDLEGMAVVNGDGVALGRVSHLFATASNDVMVVAGDRERLIPFLPGRFVMDVDRHAGKITVDWDPEF